MTSSNQRLLGGSDMYHFWAKPFKCNPPALSSPAEAGNLKATCSRWHNYKLKLPRSLTHHLEGNWPEKMPDPRRFCMGELRLSTAYLGLFWLLQALYWKRSLAIQFYFWISRNHSVSHISDLRVRSRCLRYYCCLTWIRFPDFFHFPPLSYYVILGSHRTFFPLRFINWKNRTEQNKLCSTLNRYWKESLIKGWQGALTAKDRRLLGALLMGATGMQNIASFLFESSQYFNEKTSNYYVLPLGEESFGGMGLRWKLHWLLD